MPADDPQVATKAPENDAYEEQEEGPVIAGDDTPAQSSGPAMSEHCTSDRPTREKQKQFPSKAPS